MTQDRPRDSHRDPQRGLVFGGVVDSYVRGRPGYPVDAAAWLTGPDAGAQAAGEPLTVLELGAGTGKLTEQLVALGHLVHATDPDPKMLAQLSLRLPDVRVSQGSAEELPAASGAYDVVVAAQCYHWFDPARALPEIARVLKPGGSFACVWNERDERVPWVRKLGAIIGTQSQLRDPAEGVEASALFGEIEQLDFKHRQHLNRRTILDLARSRSHVAVLSATDRERVLGDLLDLYDDYGRGMDGMALPYLARCFRTRVLDRPEPVVPEADHVAGDDGVAALDVDATMPFNLIDTADKIPRIAAELGPDLGRGFTFGVDFGRADDDALVLLDLS